MASHHKMYELAQRTHPVGDGTVCRYKSMNDGNYERLLQALSKNGTLGGYGPSITKKRKTLHASYPTYKQMPGTHLAWLADTAGEMLHPANLRRVVDFVHFKWTGQIGYAEYCP